MSNKKHLS